MVDSFQIFSFVHSLVATFGMSFNILLIYLALFKTPKIIKSYTTLIINFALTDFFACFFDMFVQQRLIPAGRSLAHVSSGFCKYISANACYVGHSLLLHFLSHTLYSLLLSFSYRYYVLFHQPPKRITLALIVLLIYIPSFLQFIVFIYTQDDPEEIVEILHERYPQYELGSDGNIVTGMKDILCFSSLSTIGHMALPVTPVYMTILILRNRIISSLSVQTSTLTENTKKLHKQLLMALTYQAMLPVFYVFAVTSYAIGQFGIYNHPALEYMPFSSFLFIPCLSPVCSFVFVTPYRQFLARVICRKRAAEPNCAPGSNTPSFNTQTIKSTTDA